MSGDSAPRDEEIMRRLMDLVYGVIRILMICIAVFFRLFTALGDAQRYVDERHAEEQLEPEVVTA
jgi:hypothetical protein